MIDRDEAEQLLERGAHVVSSEAVIVGPVRRMYLDEYTGWPSFATLTTVDSGEGRETFVALHEAESFGDGRLHVPYTEQRIRRAPTVAEDQDLSIAEEDALFDYYDVPVEGVTPVVEHLGSVLVTHEEPPDEPPDTADDIQVVELDVVHPTYPES